MPFFIIFVIIPLVEIMVFMSVGEWVGLWKTLFLAFFTAVLGGYIIKYQGLHTIAAMQSASGQGRMPVNEIFDGVCLIAAGATLITPGFVTDSIGFLLLIPPVRAVLRDVIKKRTEIHMAMGPNGGRAQNTPSNDPNVIDIEYEKIDDPTDQQE